MGKIITIFIALFLLGGFFFVIALLLTVKFSSTGFGEHTGFITAVEQEGYIFKNYRVYVKTDNSSSQEDTYCMNRNKKSLADKIQEYSKHRNLVQVYYRGVTGIGFGLCDGIEITNVTLDSGK